MIAKATTYQNYSKRTFISRVYCDFACLLSRIRDKLSFPKFSTTIKHSNLDKVKEDLIRNFDQSYTTIAHMYARNL